jgi:large conductance mechanosensitive channel
MGMVREFKEFINKGNVVDLAVGVIIGAAFGKIVTALVESVLMPVLGLAMGGVSFASMATRIGGTDAEPVLLKYGVLLQATLDFLILAFCVFLLVKLVNAARRPAEAPAPTAPPAPAADVVLLTEIRDLLKARG